MLTKRSRQWDHFRLFEIEYFCTWRDLAQHIGFHRKCLLDIDHAARRFDRHKFWNEILGQVIVEKFAPHNMDIQHPTLRFMHCWIAMTLFSRQDIQVVHNTEMQILYAMIKKIKIALVRNIQPLVRIVENIFYFNILHISCYSHCHRCRCNGKSRSRIYFNSTPYYR